MFSMLNQKYLISAFSTAEHPLGWLLLVLLGLNSTKMVQGFGMVDDYDLEPARSGYDYPLGVITRAQCQRCGGAGTDFW
jgi:hypothetical protein